MWINGKEMVGEVVEKKRAREIYESYKQVKRDPGLLEQVDYKRFEMRIFPIAAGAEQRVKITYSQELDYDHDTATYVYPLATLATPSANPQVGRSFFAVAGSQERRADRGDEQPVARRRICRRSTHGRLLASQSGTPARRPEPRPGDRLQDGAATDRDRCGRL